MEKKRVFLTRTLHDFALKELKKHYQIEVHSGKIPIPRKKLESKIESVQAPSQVPSLPLQPVKISLDDDPIRGDPNAPITIVEFSDFQCPFCARFHTQTLPAILE